MKISLTLACNSTLFLPVRPIQMKKSGVQLSGIWVQTMVWEHGVPNHVTYIDKGLSRHHASIQNEKAEVVNGSILTFLHMD